MNIIKIICGFALTGLFLTLCQSPFDISMLAWISFLPLVFIASPQTKKRWLFIFGYIICLIYWLANLYWLALPTKLGYFVFCAFVALYWPLLAISIRHFRWRNWSITFFLPILIVGFEALQGTILGGFSWRLLGHSMHTQPKIIQIADIFGVAGITFLIAMTNGFLAEILVEKPKAFYIKTAFVIAALTAAVLYGRYKLDYYENADLQKTPPIASIQTNEPLTVAGIDYKADQVFDQMLQLSRQSLQAGPALIVWPETMVLDTLEHQYLNLRGSAYSGYFYNQTLSAFAAENKLQMIVGATGGTTDYNPQENSVALADRRNSAYIYEPDGRQNPQRYDKIHLVPFGEVVPFRYSVPWLFNLLAKFTPDPQGEFSLTAGTEYFTYNLSGTDIQYAVIICYEDTMVPIVRKMVMNNGSTKSVQLLVNISNDGWFSWRDKYERKVFSTTELVQHAIIASFRAVENRVGIVRSVNTGVSCFIEPSGKIKDSYIDGTLNKSALDRRAQSGWIVDKISIDPTVTFFSRFGQWLDYLCGIVIVPIMILSFGNSRKINSHLEV